MYVLCGGKGTAQVRPTWEPKGTKRYVDLPSDLRLVHVRMQQVNAVCDLDDSSLTCQDKSPLHISCTLAPARVCSATKTCHTNQTVGVVQLGSETVQLIQQSFQVGIGISPNVTLNTYRWWVWRVPL